MRYTELLEGRDAQLYHGTDLVGAIAIVASNRLEGSQQYPHNPHGVSLTRDYRIAREFGTYWERQFPVVFVFDQDKLYRSKHKVFPRQDSYESGYVPPKEAEEMVLGDMENLDQYLISINVSPKHLERALTDVEYQDWMVEDRRVNSRKDLIMGIKKLMRHPKLNVMIPRVQWRKGAEQIPEGALPLLKGEIPRMRGSYAAFVCVMAPEDFLRLTTDDNMYKHIVTAPFPRTKEEFSQWGREDDFGRFPMPFLNVRWPSGQVTGHEGRHRAAMVMKQGGKRFPCVIFLRHETIYHVTWEEYWPESEETIDREETFGNFRDAQEKVKELEAYQAHCNSIYRQYGEVENLVLPEYSIYKIKLDYSGGATIKASPTQADPNDYWVKKPFTKEDMPKQLIGQFDDSVVVTEFKIGPVKGYRHFS